MMISDSAPCGRNAQTLSELEGSSNTGCLSQAWNPGLTVFFDESLVATLHIGKPYSIYPTLEPS